MSSVIPARSVCRFHPLCDNILVRVRRRLSDTTTGAGVLIPDTVRKPLVLGLVVAVGPGRRARSGTFISPAVGPGDEVALEPDQGTEVTVADEELLVVRKRDVLGVLTEPPVPAANDTDQPIPEQETRCSHAAREESLETDVAPDLLDREPPTGEDLH